MCFDIFFLLYVCFLFFAFILMEYQFGVYVHVIDSYCECTIFITQQNTYRSLTSRQSNRQTTTIKKNVRRNKNEAQTS